MKMSSAAIFNGPFKVDLVFTHNVKVIQICPFSVQLTFRLDGLENLEKLFEKGHQFVFYRISKPFPFNTCWINSNLPCPEL